MTEDDEDNSPVGFLGRLRNFKGLTWILIIGLLALTVGGTSLVFLFQGL